GWFFKRFNRFFRRNARRYEIGVGGIARHKALMLVVYALLLIATAFVFKLVPGGFVPAQDKGFLIAFTQLPQGATLERTEAVIDQMTDIILAEPGVRDAIAFPGLSINGFTSSSSAGIIFVGLKPFE